MAFNISDFSIEPPVRGLLKQSAYVKRAMPMSEMHLFQAVGIFNEYARCKLCGKRKDTKFHI